MLHVVQQQLQTGAVGIQAAVTCGMYARRAIQRSDHQSGIVRDRGAAAGLECGPRFDIRIFFKRLSGLLRLDVQSGFFERTDLKAQRR